MDNAYEANLQRLDVIAREHGLVFNPDPARVKKVVKLMTDNYVAAGE